MNWHTEIMAPRQFPRHLTERRKNMGEAEKAEKVVVLLEIIHRDLVITMLSAHGVEVKEGRK